MRIAMLIMVLFLLPSCGQKGPLYLPQDTGPEASARASDESHLQIAERAHQPKAQQGK